MAIIEVKNLSYKYHIGTPFEAIAVDDVSFSIDDGEFVGIIGHTGSGKSTLIQHLNGLLKPTLGRVFIDGQDVWEDKKKRQKIRFDVGLVFQYPEYQLFEETVEKDIGFGPKNMGQSETEIKQSVLNACDMVGIASSMLEKSPFELSGGQKRRVAIAGVMAMKPKVLVLDEPAAGLDPKSRENILQMIKNYHEKTNSTVLLVSHSMEDTARFADRILVMNKSKVFAFDKTNNIFNHARELKEMGLGVPQLCDVFLKLKERGIDINTNIYTIEDALQEVKRLLLKRGTLNDK